MAGNNSIQILRGNNVQANSSISGQVLLDGQPLYDKQTGYLFVGDGETTIRSLDAVHASYANRAGSATSATSASYAGCFSTNRIYFNGTYANGVAYNVGFSGNVTDVIYVPTALGSSGQVWGMTSSGRAGWINQTEIPGTIENANHANTADSATVANRVSSNLNIRVMGSFYSFNGAASVNTRSINLVGSRTNTTRGAIPYASANGTSTTPPTVNWRSLGDNGTVLSSNGSYPIWRTLPSLYSIEISGVLAVIYGSPSGASINSTEDLYNDLKDGENPRPVYGYTLPNNNASTFINNIMAQNNQVWFYSINTVMPVANYSISQDITIRRII